MEITLRGLGAICTPAQTADPSFVLSADGTQGYYDTPYGPGMCDVNLLGGTITGGTGTTTPLACCTAAQQTSPLYDNLASGDIRYLISNPKTVCNPNCSGGVPASNTSAMMMLLAALGIVVLLVASR